MKQCPTCERKCNHGRDCPLYGEFSERGRDGPRFSPVLYIAPVFLLYIAVIGVLLIT